MGAALAGGSELNPIASLELIEELTSADGSTGWVTMAASLAIGTGGAYLGDEAVEELFGGERFPVIAGQGTRPGKAVTTDGGYLLSGNWSFASGIKHSGFIHTLAIIEETGEPRIFVLPVEQATLIDNWDVLGLRATGSIDYTIDSVFVPEAYSHFAVSESTDRGGLYALGIIHIAAICHTAWALGVARRMLDELRESAQAKTGRPGQLVDSGQLPRELRQGGGLLPRRAGVRLRDLARRRGVTRPRRAAVGAPEDHSAPRHQPGDVGGPRRLHVRLHGGRHFGVAGGHDPALLPRHARRHPARDPVAACAAALRPGARGPCGRQGLGVPELVDAK